MAVIQVQKASNNNFGTSVTATFSTTPTSGNLLVGLFECQGAPAPTVTTPSGWTVPTGGNYVNTGTGGGRVVAMYKIAGASESTAVPVITSGSVNQDLAIFEYSGASSTPFDVLGSSDLASSGSSTITTGTITTTTAGVVLAVIGQSYNATNWNNAWTNSFTQQTVRAGFFETAQRITTGAVTGLNTTETWSGTAQAYSIIIAFKASAGGGDTTPPAVSSIATNGSTTVITYNEPLDASAVPAASAYTFKVNTVPRSISTVSVNGSAGTVTLGHSSVASTDTLTLSYSP